MPVLLCTVFNVDIITGELSTFIYDQVVFFTLTSKWVMLFEEAKGETVAANKSYFSSENV